MRENGLMTAEYPREGRALKRRRAPTGVAIGRATAGELSSPTSVRGCLPWSMQPSGVGA